MSEPAAPWAAALLLLASALGCGGPTSSSEDSRGGSRAVAASPAPRGEHAAPPDVVLVTIDTLRADALGFAGNADAETPVLDRLAASGRVYPDSHAHNVVTLPSHANILTGLYPYQHGVRENSGFVLDAGVPTLATELAAAGYATGAFVGAYPLDSRFGLDRGFAVYDDRYSRGTDPRKPAFAERPGDEVVAAALAWWAQVEGEPRFLWLHLYDPHAPYAPPEPWASRFAERPYLGEVAATDAFLAPLIEPFLAGTERPALLIITADHGESLGDHGELTHGLFAYEATLRVPLVLWGAGVVPGVDERAAGHIDIAPTVLAAAGLAARAAELPGRSLLAAADPAPRRLYFEALSTYFNRGWAPLRGLVEDATTKAIDLPLPELYDLAADPGERDNLLDEERRRFRALRDALPAPEEDPWPPGQRTVDAEEARTLRSLGYISASPTVRTRFTAEDDPKNLIAVDRKVHAAIDALARGEMARAEALAREIVTARPEMASAYGTLATALREQGRTGEAIEILRGALDRGVTSHALLSQLGLALTQLGRAGEAVELLAPLVTAEAGSDPGIRAVLGGALSEAGRQRQALEVLGALLAEEPDNTQALENLGAVYLRLEQPAEARRHLERAVSLAGDLPVSWNSLGVARAWLGDDRGAVAAWQRAVVLDPGQLDALYNLGVTAAKIGERATARQALERYVAIAPAERFAADIARARALLGGLGG